MRIFAEISLNSPRWAFSIFLVRLHVFATHLALGVSLVGAAADRSAAAPTQAVGTPRAGSPAAILINWENRALPTVPADTPLSLEPNNPNRATTLTLTTRWTRDGVRRLVRRQSPEPLGVIQPADTATSSVARVLTSDDATRELSVRLDRQGDTSLSLAQSPATDLPEDPESTYRGNDSRIPAPIIAMVAVMLAALAWLYARRHDPGE